MNKKMANPNWTIKLNEGERIDDLQRCNLKIIQDPKKFCFGMDAVLLSYFTTVRKGEKALDLCSGNGILPILLYGKYEGVSFDGIEIQSESADLAKRSIIANGIEDKVKVICGDIKEIETHFDKASFDVVTCNPPYMLNDHGLKNLDSPKAIARHEIMCDFTDVASAAAKMLKPGGRFYLVHRPFRLVEIFDILAKYKLEPKRMQMVHPYITHEPNMVLIEAKLGGKRRLSVEKPIIVYKDVNEYTKEILDIYGY